MSHKRREGKRNPLASFYPTSVLVVNIYAIFIGLIVFYFTKTSNVFKCNSLIFTYFRIFHALYLYALHILLF